MQTIGKKYFILISVKNYVSIVLRLRLRKKQGRNSTVNHNI